MFKNPKVFQKNADIKTVSENKGKTKQKVHPRRFRKGLKNMRIENEMLARFNKAQDLEQNSINMSLSQELDFFFDNVMDTVVDYFKEEVTV